MATAATGPVQNQGVFDIPLGMITADPKNNSRTVMGEEEVDDLAQAMKNDGQLQNVRAELQPNGKYSLVLGFRRYAAATKLGWNTIRCEVVQPGDAVTRKIANMAENLARENLNPYDQAMGFLDLNKTHAMSGSKIAHHVGKSVSYVNNLLRIAEACEPCIVRRWREEQEPTFGKDKDGKRIPTMHQVCTTDWLVKLAANVPRDQQETHLKKALGLIPDDDGDEDETEEGKRGRSDVTAVRRATMTNLEKAIEATEAKMADAKTDKEEKTGLKGVLAALKYAAGKTQGIKLGSTSIWREQTEEEKEAEKEKTKAAKEKEKAKAAKEKEKN